MAPADSGSGGSAGDDNAWPGSMGRGRGARDAADKAAADKAAADKAAADKAAADKAAGGTGAGGTRSAGLRTLSGASGFAGAGGLGHSGIPATAGLPDIGEIPDADAVAPEDDPLNGAKILIVDDDVRNVFALTSVFERYGAQVRYAENGRQGMEVLDREDDVSLVLMDVMMPELDGYATTAAIRQRPEFADLPIITVTAKAMKGDRAKSIAAGASEYVTKPVDIAHLISLMRNWLERRQRAEGSG
jgi:hypothetical protein